MKLRLFALPVILLTAVLFVSACGSDSNSTATEGTTKITASETIFALDHLLDVGFKKDKSFDVEGLTAATHAYYGFWGLDPYDRKEYEAGFTPRMPMPSSSAQYSPMNVPDPMPLSNQATRCGRKGLNTPEPASAFPATQAAISPNTATTSSTAT